MSLTSRIRELWAGQKPLGGRFISPSKKSKKINNQVLETFDREYFDRELTADDFTLQKPIFNPNFPNANNTSVNGDYSNLFYTERGGRNPQNPNTFGFGGGTPVPAPDGAHQLTQRIALMNQDRADYMTDNPNNIARLETAMRNIYNSNIQGGRLNFHLPGLPSIVGDRNHSENLGSDKDKVMKVKVDHMKDYLGRWLDDLSDRDYLNKDHSEECYVNQRGVVVHNGQVLQNSYARMDKTERELAREFIPKRLQAQYVKSLRYDNKLLQDVIKGGKGKRGRIEKDALKILTDIVKNHDSSQTAAAQAAARNRIGALTGTVYQDTEQLMQQNAGVLDLGASLGARRYRTQATIDNWIADYLDLKAEVADSHDYFFGTMPKKTVAERLYDISLGESARAPTNDLQKRENNFQKIANLRNPGATEFYDYNGAGNTRNKYNVLKSAERQQKEILDQLQGRHQSIKDSISNKDDRFEVRRMLSEEVYDNANAADRHLIDQYTGIGQYMDQVTRLPSVGYMETRQDKDIFRWMKAKIFGPKPETEKYE